MTKSLLDRRRGPHEDRRTMGIHDRDYYRDETRGSLWFTGRAPVTTGLVIVNVGVFVAQLLTSRGVLGIDVTEFFQLKPVQLFEQFQIWRLLTATFCHGGRMHLIGNMLFLWWFGRDMERLHSSREFLGFYMVAAALSSFGWALTSWLSASVMTPEGIAVPIKAHIPMIGASGAVTAVLVLYTLYNPRERIYFYGIFPIEMRWLLVFYLAEDAYGLIGPNYSPVAHVAHLTGAAFGYLYKRFDLRFVRLLSLRHRRPRLRVVVPDAEPPGYHEAARSERPSADEERRLDEVLAKISREGSDSLTPGEKEFLEAASRRFRDRRG